MAAYRWIVADDATRILDVLTRRQRAVLFRHFDHIGAFPEQPAERESGAGRHPARRVKMFGSWRITWWVDSPVKEVHILDIEKAQRGG